MTHAFGTWITGRLVATCLTCIVCFVGKWVEGGEDCGGREGAGASHSSAPPPPQLPAPSQQPREGSVVTGAELQR